MTLLVRPEVGEAGLDVRDQHSVNSGHADQFHAEIGTRLAALDTACSEIPAQERPPSPVLKIHIGKNREMAAGDGPEDPGWRSALVGLWWVLVPGQMIRQQRRATAAGTHGLTILRRLFASFACALVMIGAVVVLLSATTTLTRHPLPSIDVAIGVLLYGVFSVFVPRLIEKPLDCSSDQRLAGTYRTRFFLRLAFANAAALLGFVGFMESNNGWFYALGVAFAAIGFYRVAPSAANLAKDQQALSDASCSRSLIAALATLPPPPARSRRRNTKR